MNQGRFSWENAQRKRHTSQFIFLLLLWFVVIFEPTAQTANLWPTANRRPAAGRSLVR